MCPKPHLTNHREVHFLRRPRTQNEKRQSIAPDDLEELTAHQAEHLIRPARRPNSLADAWDDKPVSLWKHSEFTRRWLDYRKKFSFRIPF